MKKKKIKILHVAQAAGGVDRYIRMLLKYLDIATARITWEVVFINMMIVAGYEDISTRKEVQKFAKKNMGKIWNCEYISKVRKIQLSLFAWSFPVYVLFYHIYKKKHPVA